jgi:SWI/SNF-related matrix-associated actin-dependent regulator of chromatin subfamily A-like protein 1
MSALDQVSKGVRKGTIVYEQGEFALQFNWDFIKQYKHEFQVYLELTKKLPAPDRRWDDRLFCWRLKPTTAVVELLAKLTGWGVGASRECLEAMARVRKAAAETAAAQQATEDKAIELEIVGQPALTTALKNYQKAGVVYLAAKERSYLGDEQGLGKSIQLLATFEYTRGYPAVILCPPKLKSNWLRECRMWLPHRRASGIPAHLAEITIIAYTEAHKFVNFALASPKKKEREGALKSGEGKSFFFPDIIRPMTVACDEAQQVKVHSSRRTQSAMAIAKLSNSRWRYMLSGTPVENRPSDMLAPLIFLDKLEDFGGWLGFIQRYCAATKRRIGKGKYAWDISGSANGVEFNRRLRELCYIRRLKSEVLKELPAKIESIVEVEISNAAQYKRADQNIQAFVIEQKKKLMTEGQIAALALVKLNTLRMLAGEGKVEAVVEWIDTFLESGEKFVIYAHHREVLDALVNGLSQWNPACVLGGCDNVDAQVDKFMKDERCRLFIGSTIAAGFGLTLTVASHIGIVDLMWTPSKHHQVFDRVHRIGQRECVNCYYFMAPGTVDDDMWSVLSEKAAIISSTTDGEELSKEQVMAKVIRRYLNPN